MIIHVHRGGHWVDVVLAPACETRCRERRRLLRTAAASRIVVPLSPRCQVPETIRASGRKFMVDRRRPPCATDRQQGDDT